MRRVASSREGASSGVVRAEGTLAAQGAQATRLASALGVVWPAGDFLVPAVLTIQFSSHCRLEMRPRGGPPVIASFSDGKYQGPALDVLQGAVVQACGVLGAASSQTNGALAQHLGRIGVATSKVSFGRERAEVVYVLGLPTGPKFAAYQESFLPASVIVGDIAVAFRSYSPTLVQEAIPRVIEVSQGGKQALRFTVISATARKQ